jgi:hypothetical protein
MSFGLEAVASHFAPDPQVEPGTRVTRRYLDCLAWRQPFELPAHTDNQPAASGVAGIPSDYRLRVFVTFHLSLLSAFDLLIGSTGEILGPGCEWL